MTTECTLVNGVIHNLCTTAGYDFSLQIQNLNFDGTAVPIGPGAVISGSVKESVDSTSIEIDLTPYLTVIDHANGLIAWDMPAAATDQYKISGFKGVYQISLNEGGIRTIYIDSDSCFTVKKDVQSLP